MDALAANGGAGLANVLFLRHSVTANDSVKMVATKQLLSVSKAHVDLTCFNVSLEVNVSQTPRCVMVPPIARMPAMKGRQPVSLLPPLLHGLLV